MSTSAHRSQPWRNNGGTCVVKFRHRQRPGCSLRCLSTALVLWSLRYETYAPGHNISARWFLEMPGRYDGNVERLDYAQYKVSSSKSLPLLCLVLCTKWINELGTAVLFARHSWSLYSSRKTRWHRHVVLDWRVDETISLEAQGLQKLCWAGRTRIAMTRLSQRWSWERTTWTSWTGLRGQGSQQHCQCCVCDCSIGIRQLADTCRLVGLHMLSLLGNLLPPSITIGNKLEVCEVWSGLWMHWCWWIEVRNNFHFAGLVRWSKRMQNPFTLPWVHNLVIPPPKRSVIKYLYICSSKERLTPLMHRLTP